jgi:hypothetical protein
LGGLLVFGLLGWAVINGRDADVYHILFAVVIGVFVLVAGVAELSTLGEKIK